MVDISIPKTPRVNVTTGGNNDVSTNTNANAQLARSWAVGEGLIQGEDYSSKYYAQQSKNAVSEVEEAIEGIDEYIDEARECVDDAQGYANDAQESAELARTYSENAKTGLIWIELFQNRWTFDNARYRYEIDRLLAVINVYKGEWEDKKLVNSDFIITDQKTYIYASQPFHGYALTSKSIVEPESEINSSVLDIYTDGVIDASRDGRIVTLSSKNLVFEQAIASDTWVIEHNLGKYPNVITVDSSGREFRGKVEHDSNNQCTVYINGATTGVAYLN